MTSADIAAWTQLAVLATSAITIGGAMLARFAVGSHNDRLARIAGFASSVGAEINETLVSLPPGADVATIRQALVAKAVAEGTTKYGDSIKAVGLSPDALATQINRAVAALPPPTLTVAPAPVKPPVSGTATGSDGSVTTVTSAAPA
jgi:hypothetical protein